MTYFISVSHPVLRRLVPAALHISELLTACSSAITKTFVGSEPYLFTTIPISTELLTWRLMQTVYCSTSFLCCSLLRILRIRKKRLPWLQKSLTACCLHMAELCACLFVLWERVVCAGGQSLSALYKFPLGLSLHLAGNCVCISHLTRDSPFR